MRRLVILGSMFLVLAGLLTAAGSNDERNIKEFPPPGVNPPLTPSEFVWFFGYIPANAYVTHNYVMTNNHEDTVTITGVIPGCDCTFPPRTPIVVPPGESRLVKIGFDTKTYSGETNRDIHIVTDYEENPEMDLYFASVVAYQPRTVRINPPSTVFIMGKEKQEFTVSNLLDSDVKVRLILDNDSTLATSVKEFELDGKESQTFTLIPYWKKLPYGPDHNGITAEFERGEEAFRITIPVKTNKF
ncbi:MAG: DUF1573 domain-containing protein [Candidatus Zixiibacteriota bacterium]